MEKITYSQLVNRFVYVFHNLGLKVYLTEKELNQLNIHECYKEYIVNDPLENSFSLRHMPFYNGYSIIRNIVEYCEDNNTLPRRKRSKEDLYNSLADIEEAIRLKNHFAGTQW
jgi:hypothetical protein